MLSNPQLGTHTTSVTTTKLGSFGRNDNTGTTMSHKLDRQAPVFRAKFASSPSKIPWASSSPFRYGELKRPQYLSFCALGNSSAQLSCFLNFEPVLAKVLVARYDRSRSVCLRRRRTSCLSSAGQRQIQMPRSSVELRTGPCASIALKSSKGSLSLFPELRPRIGAPHRFVVQLQGPSLCRSSIHCRRIRAHANLVGQQR